LNLNLAGQRKLFIRIALDPSTLAVSFVHIKNRQSCSLTKFDR